MLKIKQKNQLKSTSQSQFKKSINSDQQLIIDLTDANSEISSEVESLNMEIDLQNFTWQWKYNPLPKHPQIKDYKDTQYQQTISSSSDDVEIIHVEPKTLHKPSKKKLQIKQNKIQRMKKKKQEKKTIYSFPNLMQFQNIQNESKNNISAKKLPYKNKPSALIQMVQLNKAQPCPKNQNLLNFRRNRELQNILNQKNRQPKLIMNILKNDPYLLFNTFKRQLGVLPQQFSSAEQYQRKFSCHHLAQVNYKIIQNLKQLNKNPLSFLNIHLRITSQTIRSDGLYQLKAFGIDRQTSSKLRQIISKYRIGAISLNTEPQRMFLAGFLEGNKRQQGEQFSTLITGKYLNHLPQQIIFCSFDKLSTQAREFDGIQNLKFTEIRSQIYRGPAWQIAPQLVQNQQMQSLLEVLKSHYNDSQFKSIKQISLKNQGIFLLQGPPGTGKTYTLLGLLSCQLKKLSYFNQICPNLNPKILVCAPSNAAADHIGSQILSKKIHFRHTNSQIPKVLRVGIQQSTCIKQISLISIVSYVQGLQASKTHLQKKYVLQKIKELQKQVKERSCSQMTNAYYKKIQLTFYQEFLLSNSKAQSISVKDTISRLQKKYINDADIIITTLSSSYSEKLTSCNLNFSCLIVDEAGQATEPSTLIPLQWGMKKVILIGDPNQLPPTTINPSSVNNKYNRSLIGRYLDSGIVPSFLSTQYRMDPLIRQFPNIQFYGNRLEDSEQIKNGQTPTTLKLKVKKVTFVDCLTSQEIRQNKSYLNNIQAEIIQNLVIKLLNTRLSIGVITPYQAQQDLIKQKLAQQTQILSQLQKKVIKLQDQVTVSTVDSYQGQQRDIIIISTVRSNHEQNIGFTSDFRRMNVALTRAKYCLITFGNSSTLNASQLWRKYLKWIKVRGSYIQYEEVLPIQSIINRILIKQENQIKKNGRISVF